jgi:hypothetical protein
MAKANEADGGEASDVALIHGVSESGDLHIVRHRNDRLELGAVRPLREGVPITGELVRLVPRKEFPLLCDVKTELKAKDAPADVAQPAEGSAHRGPPQVANRLYRDNWDRIWQSRKPSSDLN